MDITFLIGNGFDLECGLKTSYEDFYNYLIKNEHTLDLRENLIYKEIKSAKELDEKNEWSNFEFALGEMTKDIKKSCFPKFISDFNYIKELFKQYLQGQLNNFSIPEESFLKSLFENIIIALLNESKKHKIAFDKKETLNIHFISFNYTFLLENYFKVIKNINFNEKLNVKNNICIDYNVLHVHSVITKEMVIGVDNISQISNREMRNDKEIIKTLVKPIINDINNANQTEKAYELIGKSNVIGVFGISIGKTDKIWWEYLVNNWLVNKLDAFMVIYKTDSNEVKCNTDLKGRIKEFIVPDDERFNEKESEKYKMNILSRISIVDFCLNNRENVN